MIAPRHVLLISRSFPHHRAGGMEWHVQDVAEGLMNAGWRVSVLTTPLPKSPALKPLEVNGEIIEAGKNSARYDVAFFRGLVGIAGDKVRRLQPAIIHAQGFAGVAASREFGREVPVVTTVHGTLWSETALRGGVRKVGDLWRYKHRFAFAPLWKSFLRSGAPIITDSEFTVEELSREAGQNITNASVIPLGFDMNRFPLGDRDTARNSWHTTPDDLLLVTMGRLEKIKAPDQVLQAFFALVRENKHARVIIAGEGPMLLRLREELARHAEFNDRVTFTGRVSAERAPELLHAADLFLNPDHGAPAFGLANAEALCMGTPVVTTAVGAHAEIVRDPHDGWLVQPGAAFTDAVLNAAKSLPEPESKRLARAESSRHRFGRETMIQSLIGVYEELLEKRAN